jgi:hypothetical protein
VALLLPIVVVCGVIELVCWIMVLVKIFQSGSIGLGILGIICPLFAFIYGWMKVDEFGIRNIMLTWSVCFGIGIALNFVTMSARGH